MFPKRTVTLLIMMSLGLGMIMNAQHMQADFHEDFEGPSIDPVNWIISDYGGLAAEQANGKLYINGTYDSGETAPGTAGWNQLRLIFNQSSSGFLDISVTDSITSAGGPEYSVGMGIMENSSVVWDNITSWAQRYYPPTTNAIGWVDSWFNGIDTKVTFDDTDIAFLEQHTHRLIHHTNSTVQFILDGETKGWLPISITSFYPFLHVGIKGGGTFIEAVFDDYHIITDPPTPVLEASNENPDVDEIIMLDGTMSHYQGAEIESYSFEFGDGQSTGWIYEPFVYHIYSAEGSFDARLKVLGDNGQESGWATVSICVECAIPIANLTATPLTIGTLGSVEFSAIQSTDSDGEILGYFFDYGDWSDSGWIMSPFSNYSYWYDGIFDARLKVLDDDGHESNWSEPITITVLNDAPIPLFWYSSDHVNQGENVTLDGSKSFDPDGWVTSWFFDFGDSTSTGWISYPNVTYVYQDIGEYMVSLKVRDNDGRESTLTTSHRFYVHNTPPVAIVTVYDPVVAPTLNAIFNASYSYDPDGVVGSYFFDFGDGTDSGWITSHTTGHTYLDEGVYDITVKVRDDDGAESVWSTAVQIQVERRLPRPYLNSTTVEVFEGEEAFLSGQFSTGFDGHIRFWIFDFGDGSTTGWISTPYTTHVYPEAGEYVVTLRVRDSSGGESVGVDQLTIHVMEEEDAQDAEFNWWMVLAIVLLVLLIVALLIVFQQRKQLNELRGEVEGPEEEE